MEIFLGLIALFVVWAVLFGPRLRQVRQQWRRR